MPLHVGTSGMCRQADKMDAIEIPPRLANSAGTADMPCCEAARLLISL